jgi:hypothetical protein
MFRPKVTVIEKSNYLDTIRIEELVEATPPPTPMNSPYLNPRKKNKNIALKIVREKASDSS